jgi:hypothetical protein
MREITCHLGLPKQAPGEVLLDFLVTGHRKLAGSLGMSPSPSGSSPPPACGGTEPTRPTRAPPVRNEKEYLAGYYKADPTAGYLTFF